MTKSIYIAILTLLFVSCSGKTGRQDEAVQNDSLSVVCPAGEMAQSEDSAVCQAQFKEVRQRVAAIYDDVVDHYNHVDLAPWSGDVYLSDKFLRLWAELPNDEEVIEIDPWIMAQDYDTVACKEIEVTSLKQDSALVSVGILLSENWPTHKIQLQLVREQHKDVPSAEWYIDDFQSEDYSITAQIKAYIEEFKQN